MPKVPSIQLNNGYKMPVFGLGTWKSPKGQVEEAVKVAIDCGYRLIDCAHCYQNEREVGNALRQKMADGTVKRQDLFITTKLWNTFHDPKSVRRAFEVSLKNLQLDYVDLYLIHWPMSYKEDGDNLFPLDANGEFIDGGADFLDTWKAMEELVDAGLVRSIGLSNFNAKQVDRVLKIARIKPVTNQVECHPYLNQKRLKAHCEARKMVITAYSPLGSPDRPWAVKGEPQLIEEPKIVEIAKKHGKMAAHVLFRYQIQRGIIVIPKSVTAARIQSNIDTFDFELTENDIKEIDGIDCNGRLCPETAAAKHRDHPFTNDEY